MPFREDLDAALERTAAAEQELAAERKAHDADRARITALETQLAETKPSDQAAPSKETPSKETPSKETKGSGEISPLLVRLFIAVVVVPILGLLCLAGYRSWQDLYPPPIDLDESLARAQVEAHKHYADAALVSIKAKYVDPRGRLMQSGDLDFVFVSPAAALKPAPPTVPGMPHDGSADPLCGITVEFRWRTHGRMDTWDIHGSGATCGVPLAHPPSCTAAQVWSEAIRRGAPANGVATYFTLASVDKIPTWTVDVNPVFRQHLVDNCPFPH